MLDPRAKARLDKERELESDLHNATELFGSSTLKGMSLRRQSSRRVVIFLTYAYAQAPLLMPIWTRS